MTLKQRDLINKINQNLLPSPSHSIQQN
uniref:Uncharacterized protein n=1 Tax=Anguilla anguilla TaxID=7936 RepID=A0A0E9UYE4_ANGAN